MISYLDMHHLSANNNNTKVGTLSEEANPRPNPDGDPIQRSRIIKTKVDKGNRGF